MKAKYFKRLRKQIIKIQTYSLKITNGLFGDFYGSNKYILITASSPLRAIQIYMRNYRKKYKQRSNYESDWYKETSERWATLMVKDENGYKYFYR